MGGKRRVVSVGRRRDRLEQRRHHRHVRSGGAAGSGSADSQEGSQASGGLGADCQDTPEDGLFYLLAASNFPSTEKI